MAEFRYLEAEVHHIDSLIPFGKESFSRAFGYLFSEEDLTGYLDIEFTNDHLQYWIREECYLLLVALNLNDEVVGYSLTSRTCGLPLEKCTRLEDISRDKIHELKKLYVSSKVFGTGVANTLLNMSIDWLQQSDPTSILCLNVHRENLRAINFYKKHDFELVGDYWFQIGQTIVDPQLIMALFFPNS
jgi:ribosomal protein S18 acetylase RimI-like enzyme